MIKLMIAKYQPIDTVSRVELRQALNGVKIRSDENPTKLFKQINAIKNRYSSGSVRIDEAELIAVVIDAAPTDYKVILTAEQRAKRDALTLDNLAEAMNHHWRISGSKKDESENWKEEKKLY